MVFFILFSFGALVAATIMAFAAHEDAAYWRACALLLWLGAAGFVVHAAVGGVEYAVPLGMFFLIAGVIGVLAKVVNTGIEKFDSATKEQPRPSSRRW